MIVNRNLEPGYWDGQWRKNVKKFPRWTMNRIAWLVTPGTTVLDIGCGDGTFMLRLEKQLSCKTYGLDISQEAINKLHTKKLRGEVANCENIDHIDGKYDIVISAHLFEHIENHENLAKNVGRLTKQFAIIAVPNDCSYPEKTGEHVRKYNKKELIDLMKESGGFKTFEDHTIGNHIIIKCKQ